ncbi:hypothetical protein HNV12_05110 [Methanococcoides sp. SA1]|nr:hypothetical protein [Methanococcoides sp. SA1]
MKKIIVICLVLLMALPILAEDKNSDEELIKKVIQSAYVDGLQNEGDFEKIDAGFHPDFELIGIGKGDEMWHLPIGEWKERTKKKLAEGKLPKTKNEEMVSIKFLDVDITGTVAVAKFEFYVGKELKYIDYQSLYKFESGWKIVSKVFYKFPAKD